MTDVGGRGAVTQGRGYGRGRGRERRGCGCTRR